jgi:RHS repeat-associated protein
MTRAYCAHTGDDRSISGSVGDWNSDGAADIWVVKYSGDIEIPFDFTPELMTTISNGIGAAPTWTIAYDRLNKNAPFYTKGTSAALPERDVDGPLYEVKQVDVSNGAGGVYSKTYAYAGAVADNQGRGFLGFTSVTMTDSQTGIVETTNYRTDFPFVGQIASTTQTGPKTGGGTVTLSTIANTLTDTNLGGGTDGVVRHFVSLQESVTAANDLDGTALPGLTTDYTYDAQGNRLTVNTSVTDGSSKAVTNTWLYDPVRWFLGRVKSTVVTNTVGSSVITRKSCFLYDTNTGLLTREVIEPISTTNCVASPIGLQTDYAYDAFAHVQTTTISGSGIATRTKSALYDAVGQFQTQGCNTLNQCETYLYDARFGERSSLTDPNNLTTAWTYDTFGRLSLETRADGTKTALSYAYCNGVNGGTASCPSLGAIHQLATPQNAGGTQNGPQTAATFDSLLRKVADDVQGFNGAWIRTSVQYDADGRVAQTSRPYFTAGSTPAWTINTYDALGRATGKSYPNGGSQTFAYHGLSVSTVNDLSQTTTTVKNAQGLVASVTDALSNTASYVYDAFGDPTSVTDALGNTIVSTYDVRGNKTASTDPDLGHWTYGHDVLGELTTQTDAKSQTTTLTYDLAAHLTSRSENNLVSTWTYGASAASHNVGKLTEAKACITVGCTTVVSDRTFFYDGQGRPSSNTLTTGGANYTYSRNYNGDGRLLTTTYPSGFAAKNVYGALGYLSQIKDNASGTALWTVTNRDAELHATGQAFGNGVAETDSYDPDTGFLTNLRAGPSDSVAAFDYAYDTLGNLTYRSDNFSGVFEYACYDALNRLQYDAAGNATTSCMSPGAKTVAYDALGDIAAKTGVGTYHYPAPGTALPHAVASVSGTVNGVTNPHYGYDADGNMVCEYVGASCGGSGVVRESASWTAFNKVAQLAQGTTSISLTYDSEHSRILQHRQFASTVEDTTYLNDPATGTMEEHVVLAGTTTWRDYIQGDGHIVAEKFSGATVATRYMVSDHLGSVAVLTDETGAVAERDAYDAWGKRRKLDGTDDTACALVSQTTRGFTGHEHIDDLCLIDANARLYDPTLGRFLSPDDTIPEPTDMQSFNRFSYVRNRPLSVTDPTGHDDGCAVQECVVARPDYDDDDNVVAEMRGADTEGSFYSIADGTGETLPGLISWGSAAAGATDATAGTAAPSAPAGGSKPQNDKRNAESRWRVSTYHQNADGTWTVAAHNVDGTVADIVAAMALDGYSVQVSAAGADVQYSDGDLSLSFKTMSGGPGQVNWAGKFETSEGAPDRGYVIQKIVTTEVYTDKDGVHDVDPMIFWEGFGPFAKGAQITGKNNIPDDCFCLARRGTSGIFIVTGSARLYPMDELPPTFKTPNPDTRAGTAPSTIYDPHLSPVGASSVLNRIDIYSYGGD